MGRVGLGANYGRGYGRVGLGTNFNRGGLNTRG
jgi:hypothetical protein